jgi:hypothetical protein
VSRPHSALTNWLATAPKPVFTLFAMTAAFSTYFCMYAFRKPFSAATFEGLNGSFFGTEFGLKTMLVVSQLIGYTVSKFLGVKFCSEIQPNRRGIALVGLILWAEAALIAFALLPIHLKFVPLFLNGLSLGMVWGLVVWYLEGRQTSELLLAGLSCSFIIASAMTKDFGRALLSPPEWASPILGSGVTEMWMPAVTGAIFLPAYLLSVWLLSQVPKPSAEDEAERSVRETMDSTHRLAFVRHFLLGLLLLLVTYFFLTAYRDYRDNFTVELFNALDYKYDDNKTIITRSELIVAFGVMAMLAALNGIKDNRRGLIGAFTIMAGGLVLMGTATLLRQGGWINGFWWMTACGLGSYLAYVPYGSVLFDRLIAYTRVVGTAVFAIYVADAVGYSGSILTLIVKDRMNYSHLQFFETFSLALSVVGFVFLLGSCVYFLTRHRRAEA